MSSSPWVSPWLRPQSFAPSAPGSMVSTSFRGHCEQCGSWVGHRGLGDCGGGYGVPRPPRVTVRMKTMAGGQQGGRGLECGQSPERQGCREEKL